MKATIPITLSSENQLKNKDPDRYTLMVIGDNNCGKTCLLKSFVMSDFEVNGIFISFVFHFRCYFEIVPRKCLLGMAIPLTKTALHLTF